MKVSGMEKAAGSSFLEGNFPSSQTYTYAVPENSSSLHYP